MNEKLKNKLVSAHFGKSKNITYYKNESKNKRKWYAKSDNLILLSYIVPFITFFIILFYKEYPYTPMEKFGLILFCNIFIPFLVIGFIICSYIWFPILF